METTHPIRRYRADHGLTLEAFGLLLSVHKSTVKRWEDGAIPIPVERLGQISDITGIPRHELRPDIYPGPERAA